MKNKTLNLLVGFLTVGFLLYPPVASAYIGPGLGAGALTVVLGIISGLLMLVVGVVWYPLKKLVRRFKGKTKEE